MAKNSRWSKIITWLKITLALGLIGFILSKISLGDLVDVFNRISWPWLLAYGGAFGGGTWCMARRYHILVSGKISLGHMVRLVILQNALGNLIGTSIGAFSFVALLNREHKIAIPQTLAALLVGRAGDILLIFLVLLGTSPFLWSFIGPIHIIVILLLIGLSVGILLFGIILFQPRATLKKLETLPFLRQRIQNLAIWAEGEGARVLPALQSLLLYSSLVFGFSSFSYYCSLRVFGIFIDPIAILFIVSLVLAIGIIPIQVFGGLGVNDISFIFLFRIFGVDEPLIVPAIVGLRILFYTLNLVSLAYLPLDNWWRRSKAVTTSFDHSRKIGNQS